MQSLNTHTMHASRYPDALAEYVKHWVLDRAHPLPTALRVYPGPPGTLAYAVTRAVLARVGGLEGLQERGADAALPAVWVEEGEEQVEGLTAVARYLGRLWRLYPCKPESALHVDASLDLLARFAHEAEASTSNLPSLVASYARVLEARLARLARGDVWMEGMDACSLADVCWQGVFVWARSVDAWDLFGEEELPHLAVWWEAMCEE